MNKNFLDYLYEKLYENITIIDKCNKDKKEVPDEFREKLFLLNSIIELYLKSH